MNKMLAAVLLASLFGCAGVMEPGVDRPGSDYKDFDLSSASPALCKKACDSDSQCKAWTYVLPNTTQGPNPRCWLKNSVPDPTMSSCCVSGTK